MTRLAIGAFFWKGARTLIDVACLITEYKDRAAGHLTLDRSREIARKRIKIMEDALTQLNREISIVETA